MNVGVVEEVKERLLSSPSKSLRRLSQEMNVPYSACQRAAKKAKIHAYRVTCVQELQPTDHEKRMQFRNLERRVQTCSDEGGDHFQHQM